MDIGTGLGYVFLLLWSGFVVRGFLTGRMLARGGDIVRESSPRVFAVVMIGNVVTLCVVLVAIAIS